MLSRRTIVTTEAKELQARSQRKEIDTKVEFIVDDAIETAQSVNISEDGLQFATERPVRFRMRLSLDGTTKEYLALLVWAKKNTEGGTSYGFQFIPDDNSCVI